VSPEQLLRAYFRAKDENRPHLLVDVFSSDARLTIDNRCAQISFPGVTVGLEGIADVLVRQFNSTYENIYSFYLDRPGTSADTFACDWLVCMTEKASRNVRVGCGHYDWTFQSSPVLLVANLVITIEEMVVLASARSTDVMRSLLKLDYPWSSARQVTSALSIEELQPVRLQITRKADR
jgi:hypothetical protein